MRNLITLTMVVGCGGASGVDGGAGLDGPPVDAQVNEDAPHGVDAAVPPSDATTRTVDAAPLFDAFSPDTGAGCAPPTNIMIPTSDYAESTGAAAIAGGLVVVTSHTDLSNDANVVLRRKALDGSALAPDLTLSNGAFTPGESVAVTANATEIFAAWYTNHALLPGDIRFARVPVADGTASYGYVSYGDVRTSATTVSVSPYFAGNYAVAWRDVQNGLADVYDIRVEIVDGAGTFVAAYTATSPPGVASLGGLALGDDSLGIVFTGERDGHPEVFFAAIRMGSASGPLSSIPLLTTTNGSHSPSIVAKGTGFGVAYGEDDGTGARALRLVEVGDSGSLTSPVTIITPIASGHVDINPKLVHNSAGYHVLYSHILPGPREMLFARMAVPAGVVAAPYAVNDAAIAYGNPADIVDSGGSVVAVWDDSRNLVFFAPLCP